MGDREYWRHSQGQLENTVGNTWEEQSPGARFSFQETDRTQEYVQLYDASRNCTVRLYSNVSLVSSPLSNFEFRTLYFGGWGSK